MIEAERGSSGAWDTSWFQARWSGSERAVAGSDGLGFGNTPHFVPSDG